MKVRIPKNLNTNQVNNQSKPQLIEPKVSVEFDEPVSPGENLLAIMLLHIAHEQPDVIERRQMISASNLTFPEQIVAQICNIPVEDAGNTIPNDKFRRIIQALMTARLVATFQTEIISYPYLPVSLFDIVGEPAIIFDSTPPQCYYTQEQVGTEKVFQLRLCGALKERFSQAAEEFHRLRGC